MLDITINAALGIVATTDRLIARAPARPRTIRPSRTNSIFYEMPDLLEERSRTLFEEHAKTGRSLLVG